MQIEELKQNRFVRNFVRDRWLILGSSGLILVFAAIYIGLIYKPSFASEAKVWIKDTSTASYLSSGSEGSSYLRPLSTVSNPIMAQIEILNSNEMEDALADFVKQREIQKNGGKVPDRYKGDRKPNTRNVMKIKTEPNNDIIQVKLRWSDPVMARDMLNEALRRFDAANLRINREIYTKKRAYLDNRIADIENRLVAVRNKIKNYQSSRMAVDVETQTQELVRLRSQLVAQMESTMAARNNNSSYASALQHHLRMSPRAALTAVALGSGNENLVKLRSDLAVLKQQAAHDSIRLAPTNPQLIAMKSQIQALESQIREEIRQTVGKSGVNGPRIYDSVRSQLVQDLTSARTRTSGLGSEAASLRASISRVDATLRAIPQSRFMLANLQEEEKTLADAFNELRRKQIDASIKEAETPSNVFIVDAPTLPERASFPTSKHVLALSLLLGLMAGLGLSTLKTYAEDLAEGPESIAEATRGKILGIIPWLVRPVARSTDENVRSINDVAYKHLVSNLRLEASKSDAEVIAFTSSSLKKPQVSTAYQLARRLTRLGHSVVLIDADFRPSNLFQFLSESTEGQNMGLGMDLSDLIMDVELKLRKGHPVYPEEILSGLRMDGNGVHLALSRHELDHAYDYFASRGFRHIVNLLKEQFDWVFIDTPSAAIAPEFVAIAQMSDGVVLFADRLATFSTLRQIARKIRDTQIPLLGTVIREINPQLERDHAEYANWRGHRGGGGAVATVGGPTLPARRVEFMGARIDALSMEETLERIDQIIQHREKVQHVVVNVAKLMSMQNDPQLREIVNGSGLINADGAGVVLGANLLGINIPERVTGIDLMQELIKVANQRGYRIYFLGAQENVIRDVVTTYKQHYPGLQICGYRNGYFKSADELEVVSQIRDAHPDILFVGMSSPRKEKFINQYMNVMNVPFVMGVGGSFDVVAGKVRRAPRWMQSAGLEWFYRFSQEPGRMWKRYLVTNTQYGWALATQLISSRLGFMTGMRAANG
jgi:N-acetylglucosaminyldiphosphoundecaprenol N-acetyl-beta-D-mannosaminyltransferase